MAVHVGSEFRQEFECAKQIVQFLGTTESDAVVSDTEFRFGGETFIFSDEVTNVQAESFHMDEDGATWFHRFRRGTGAAQNEMTQSEINRSRWNPLMEALASKIHQKHVVLRYEQHQDIRGQETRANSIANRFYDAFFAQETSSQLQRSISCEFLRTTREMREDIYGMTVRLLMASGVTSQRVIGRVYFSCERGAGGTAQPIPKGIAGDYEKVQLPVTANSSSKVSTIDAINRACEAMNALVVRQDLNLADYLCLEPSSVEIIRTLYPGRSDEEATLTCQKIEPLYITHTDMLVQKVNVYANGKHYFEITLWGDHSVSVTCANCRELLVDRSAVMLDGEMIRLNMDDADFGLSEDQFERIREKMQQHFRNAPCKDRCSGKIVCASQLTEYEFDGKTILCCTNCNRPEVQFTDFMDSRTCYYTPQLSLAIDQDPHRIRYETKNELHRCNQCHRHFEGEGNLCPLCNSLKNGQAEKQSQKKRYRAYRTLLPFSVRMRSLLKEKRCVMDRELILFQIGNEVYCFFIPHDQPKGYIRRPIRIK